MKHIRPGLAVALALAAASGAQAQEGYTIIDKFDAAPLNPTRYFDGERQRQIVGTAGVANSEALVLRLREYGGNRSDTGRVAVNWGDELSRPARVTQLRATLTVTSNPQVTGCAANPETSRMRARLLGTFFNSGKPGAGSFAGDLLAQIFVYRDADSTDPANTLRVAGGALVCGSSDCNSGGTSLGPNVDLGTVTVGTPITLRMEWDRANKRIVFARDGQPAQFQSYGSVNDSLSPGRPLQVIQLRADLENCTTSPPPRGDMTVRVDDVFVNASAAAQ